PPTPTSPPMSIPCCSRWILHLSPSRSSGAPPPTASLGNGHWHAFRAFLSTASSLSHRWRSTAPRPGFLPPLLAPCPRHRRTRPGQPLLYGHFPINDDGSDDLQDTPGTTPTYGE